MSAKVVDMRRLSICQSTPAFFGLQPTHRAIIHEEIFLLCYYGKGGFTHNEVYNMPRYLRTFYLKQIEKLNAKQAEAQKEAENHQQGKSEVFGPPVLPKS